LPPGHYEPKYESVLRRKDQFIQAWDRTRTAANKKLDVTKAVRMRDSKVSKEELAREDDELISRLMNKLSARRLST